MLDSLEERALRFFTALAGIVVAVSLFWVGVASLDLPWPPKIHVPGVSPSRPVASSQLAACALAHADLAHAVCLVPSNTFTRADKAQLVWATGAPAKPTGSFKHAVITLIFAQKDGSGQLIPLGQRVDLSATLTKKRTHMSLWTAASRAGVPMQCGDHYFVALLGIVALEVADIPITVSCS